MNYSTFEESELGKVIISYWNRKAENSETKMLAFAEAKGGKKKTSWRF